MVGPVLRLTFFSNQKSLLRNRWNRASATDCFSAEPCMVPTFSHCRFSVQQAETKHPIQNHVRADISQTCDTAQNIDMFSKPVQLSETNLIHICLTHNRPQQSTNFKRSSCVKSLFESCFASVYTRTKADLGELWDRHPLNLPLTLVNITLLSWNMTSMQHLIRVAS